MRCVGKADDLRTTAMSIPRGLISPSQYLHSVRLAGSGRPSLEGGGNGAS